MVAVLMNIVLALCYWKLIVEVEIDSGGGGGGGDDYIAARCWSIDPARDIGIRGVRDGHAKDVRRQHFYPFADSNFTL